MTLKKAYMCPRCPHAKHLHGTFGCLAPVSTVAGATRACPCPHEYKGRP